MGHKTRKFPKSIVVGEPPALHPLRNRVPGMTPVIHRALPV